MYLLNLYLIIIIISKFECSNQDLILENKLTLDNETFNSTKWITIKKSKFNFNKYKNLSSNTIFKNLNIDYLCFENVEFISNIPSTIFFNTSIHMLTFRSCKFTSILTHSRENISRISNINIRNIQFIDIKQGFNELFIDKYIFKHIESVFFINTPIKYISNKFTSYFNRPLNIHYNNGMKYSLFEWLANITNNNYSSMSAEDMIYLNFYDTQPTQNIFDDANICKFKHYPHDQYVIPVFDQHLFDEFTNINCTCLIYWVFQKINEYKNELDGSTRIINACFNDDSDLKLKINDKCDFNKKFSICDDNVLAEEKEKNKKNFLAREKVDKNKMESLNLRKSIKTSETVINMTANNGVEDDFKATLKFSTQETDQYASINVTQFSTATSNTFTTSIATNFNTSSESSNVELKSNTITLKSTVEVFPFLHSNGSSILFNKWILISVNTFLSLIIIFINPFS